MFDRRTDVVSRLTRETILAKVQEYSAEIALHRAKWNALKECGDCLDDASIVASLAELETILMIREGEIQAVQSIYAENCDAESSEWHDQCNRGFTSMHAQGVKWYLEMGKLGIRLSPLQESGQEAAIRMFAIAKNEDRSVASEVTVATASGAGAPSI